MNLKTPDVAKTLARRLFIESFPNAGTWFDVAWDTLVPGVSPTEGATVSDLLNGLGVGRADPRTQAMAREVAILFDALMGKFPIVAEELADQLKASCDKHRKPPKATERLMRTLNRTLAMMEEPPTCEHFFVEWFTEGQLGSDYIHKNAPITSLTTTPFDLIIDERTEDVLIAGTPSQKLLQIPRSLRVMLWLALTNRGKAVGYETIAQLAGLPWATSTASSIQCIHEYRKRLKKDLLHQLAGRIFYRGKPTGYQVLEDWSFCWVRERPEPRESKVLLES